MSSASRIWWVLSLTLSSCTCGDANPSVDPSSGADGASSQDRGGRLADGSNSAGDGSGAGEADGAPISIDAALGVDAARPLGGEGAPCANAADCRADLICSPTTQSCGAGASCSTDGN